MNLKSKFLYLFSDILNKALPFISVFYITKHLDPSEYGVLELLVSFYILYGFIVTFGFDGWMLSKYYKMDNVGFFKVVSSFLLITTSLSLLLFLFALFFYSHLAIVFLVGFSSSLINIYTTILRLNNEYAKAGFYLLFNSVLNFTLLIALFELYNASLESRLLGLSITAVVTLFLLLRMFYSKFYQRVSISDFVSLRSVLIFGLPLSLSVVSSWVKGNVDKLYISQLLSTSELGIYSLALQVSSVINVVCISVNKILQTSFMRKLSSNESILKEVSITSLVLVFMSLLYFYILNNFVFLFVDEAYQRSSDFIPYLLLSFWFGSVVMLLNNIFIFEEKTKFIFFQVLVVAISQLSLSYFFIHKYAIEGALYSNLISSFLGLLITIFFIAYLKKNCNKEV
ncbi:oligosaccharide flippase family protein [Vibrio diabolicus]|uniref:oligosaccharide flippase family protein n=1 Tax=Vibrio diabolicus TaxID=50719 RepID=UPI003751A33B